MSLGLNIYGWKLINVNYKLIFQFNFHYSELGDINKRIGFWSILYLLTLIWYIIIELDIENISDKIDFIDKFYIPCIFTILFILHLIYPSKKYFNY